VRIPAINYFHRPGSTKTPASRNLAVARSKGVKPRSTLLPVVPRSASILRAFSPANGFGPEYLTYVLLGDFAGGPPSESGRSAGPPVM